MFSRRNFHKNIWTAPDGKTHDKFNRILIDRRKYSSILNVRSVTGAVLPIDNWWLHKLGKNWQQANKQQKPSLATQDNPGTHFCWHFLDPRVVQPIYIYIVNEKGQ
jgi:hypothetical protein